MGSTAHPLSRKQPPRRRQPLARLWPTGCRLRHRIRGTGHGCGTARCWHPGEAAAHGSVIWSARAGTRLQVSRLDDIAADLLVEAACITQSGNTILYQFSVSAAGSPAARWTRRSRAQCRPNHSRFGRDAMKHALVTGGSGAIGAAICRRLAADGCQSIFTPIADWKPHRRWPIAFAPAAGGHRCWPLT